MIIINTFVQTKGTNKAMNKNKEKRNSYNFKVIDELSSKYDVTGRYVRMCINGDRKGIFPEKILQEYKTIDKQLTETLSIAIKK